MLMITFQNRFGDKPNNNETVPPHLGQLFFIFRTVYFWFTFNVVNKKKRHGIIWTYSFGIVVHTLWWCVCVRVCVYNYKGPFRFEHCRQQLLILLWWYRFLRILHENIPHSNSSFFRNNIRWANNFKIPFHPRCQLFDLNKLNCEMCGKNPPPPSSSPHLSQHIHSWRQRMKFFWKPVLRWMIEIVAFTLMLHFELGFFSLSQIEFYVHIVEITWRVYDEVCLPLGQFFFCRCEKPHFICLLIKKVGKMMN